MTRTWTGSNGGVDWTLTLDRDDLLPGRLVGGVLRATARKPVDARGLIVTLRGVEHWRYEVTTSNGKTTTTTVHTGREDLPALPVRLTGPVALAAGETRELPFELPGPPLGPPTVLAEDAGVDWTVEVKLDREGGFDAGIEVPVRVHQPVALLRAGVVPVAAFALYESASGDEDGDLAGSAELDPVPLAAGSPFTGRVTLHTASPVSVRSIRAELKVRVEATVGGGLKQTLTAWSETIAGAMSIADGQAFALRGVLDADVPPTVDLPHGRVSARFELILDRPLRPDLRLGRDVAVATTLEL
ncbi:MAG TPA: hypothetical protein VFQ75_12430 [Candidatus Limnocylindrales bacterium]|nr:hypothetical protein [Candidatus Limnocylindrales bacterium]